MKQAVEAILISSYKILWKEGGKLFQRRTDLALEAHEMRRSGDLPSGVVKREREVCGYPASVVAVTDEEAARALGKPIGTYVTLDLRPYWRHEANALERAATAVGTELRALIGTAAVPSALVAGLGNAAMTPDSVGPQAAEHVLVTRHLARDGAFAGLSAVSVLTPGVLGRTGMESAEILRGAARAVKPDVLIAVDALASRSLSRLCATVQLSDAGIVPGSGVGNCRKALNRETLGVPVIAVGVPTVVDAATLALDILEEAGAPGVDPAALRGHGETVMVTPRDVDAQIRELARIVGYGIDLALQPLSYAELCALMG